MLEQYIPIKHWAKDERPREKLLKHGTPALSTNELFAILLRSGQEEESALDLARRILSDCNNDLNLLARMDTRDLMNRYKGIGIAKAASIIAAIEIGRRRKLETARISPMIKSSVDVYHYMAPLIADLDHEEFWAIYLNNSNYIKGSERLSIGGMSGTVVDLRILFRKALDMKANAIIIAHNHPSGSLTPSRHDKSITEKIREAGMLLDIILHDHLIIGSDSYFSFVDAGIMEGKKK